MSFHKNKDMNRIKMFSRSKKINNPYRDVKGQGGMRSNSTIKRLKMYKQKPIRNKKGMIIGGQFMSRHPDEPIKRIIPSRKWFGNTHVIGQKELDSFREEMAQAVNDPFTVILKQRKLPMGLLADESFKNAKPSLLTAQSFESTFGKKSTRKRPQTTDYNSLESLLKHIGKKNEKYKESDDIDSNVTIDPSNRALTTFANSKKIFEKGQSKRIWAELYKVIDASDVLVQVLDVRNPMGTRCYRIENELKEKDRRHKHMVLLLNKCDLVPTWVTAGWVKKLGSIYPTIAFHASITNSFGKGALISLLRQFADLHPDKPQISVGFVGYPNVGKSSIINTLKQKKVCVAAPVPGQTKVWQYITLFRRVFLVDCPGVVYPSDDTDEEIVLKGVVRVQTLEDPENYIGAVLKRVRKEYIWNAYGIEKWDSPEHFMEQFCIKTGKLFKKGEPDVHNAASMILHDWQRGRLPYFIPPVITEEEKKKLTGKMADITIEQLFKTIPVKNKFVFEDAQAPSKNSKDNEDQQDKEGEMEVDPKHTENENEEGEEVDPKHTENENEEGEEVDKIKEKNNQEQKIDDQKASSKKKRKLGKLVIPPKNLTVNPWGGKKKSRKRRKHQRQRELQIQQDYQIQREKEIQQERKDFQQEKKNSIKKTVIKKAVIKKAVIKAVIKKTKKKKKKALDDAQIVGSLFQKY